MHIIQFPLFDFEAFVKGKCQNRLVDVTKGFKEKQAIEVSFVGFDKNNVHVFCKFLPKYFCG
jgi:hypothetical protein